MPEPSCRQVLFPTDFSPASEAAFPYAAALARRFGARLHLLHVITPHDLAPPGADGAFPSLEAHCQSMVCLAEEDFGRKVAGPPLDQVVCRKRVERAISAPEAILDYVRDEAIDVVVMATHGRRGLRHLLFGSVAEQVLRHCPRPVWTIRADGRGCVSADGRDLTARHILVPTDLSPNSTRALPWAARLMAAEGGRVTLLHVVESGFHPSHHAAGFDSILDLDPGLRPRLERRVAELFGLSPDSPGPEVRVVDGRAPAAIVEFTAAQGVDLVIMANNGYDEVADYLVGSTTERVIRLAGCPVFVA